MSDNENVTTGASVSELRGVGPARESALKELGVETVGGLAKMSVEEMVEAGIQKGHAKKVLKQAKKVAVQEEEKEARQSAEVEEEDEDEVKRVAVIAADGWGDTENPAETRKKVGKVAMAMMEAGWEPEVVLRCGDGMGGNIIAKYGEKEAMKGRWISTVPINIRWNDIPKTAHHKEVKTNSRGKEYYTLAPNRRVKEVLATADALLVVSNGDYVGSFVNRAKVEKIPIYNFGASSNKRWEPEVEATVANASTEQAKKAVESAERGHQGVMDDRDGYEGHDDGKGVGQKRDAGYSSGQ